MIASVFYLYLITSVNINMNQTSTNANKIIPVYVFFFNLLIWTIKDTVNIFRKNISYTFLYKFEKEVYSSQGFITGWSDNFSEKIIKFISYSFLIIGYVIFMIVFSLTIVYLLEYDQQSNPDLTKTKEQNNIIKILTLIALLLLLFGNSYNFGKLLIDPLFYSIEKRYFVAANKEFYYKMVFADDMSASLIKIDTLYSKVTAELKSKTNSNLKKQDGKINLECPQEEKNQDKIEDELNMICEKDISIVLSHQ